MLRSFRSRSRRGAIVMLLTVMLPFLLLPAVGLAIDETIAHIVQTKLQAAVDGAALGAGRLLGTVANPTEIAGEFFKANFSTGSRGFWNATLPTGSGSNPSVTVTTGIQKTITVYAVANVPTLFMRLIGKTTWTVNAVAQATRRDARFVFVLDRSGSMATSKLPDGNYPIDDVKSYAAGLIKGFTPGEDEVGLVVFDGSGVVGYPSTTTYTPSVVSTGGPDTSFWDGSSTGKSSPPDAVYQVGQVSAGGGTGMADALTLAYIELQKAHLRDLAANGVDNKMNAILLFTDGVPSGISIFANDPNNGGPWLTSGSGCTNYNKGSTNPIYFWVAESGPVYDYSSSKLGSNSVPNNQLASYGVTTTHSPLWWMQSPGSSSGSGDWTFAALPSNEGASTSTCGSNLSSSSWYTYLTKIPATDKWGNSTTKGDGSYYHDSYFVDGSPAVHSSTVYVYKSSDGDLPASTSTAPAATSPYYWGLSMWDTVDNAAKTIRTDANYTNRGESSPMYIQIFTIGYDGNGGTDAGLLKRVANDPDNTDSPNSLPSAWSSQPTGKFCLASNSAELAGCFNNIGSILLRLTM